MNALVKAYHSVRCLGPRVLWLRACVGAHRRLGLTRRRFAPRPWSQIDLAAVTQPGTPTSPTGYATFKTHNPPAFLFSPGRPPTVPDEVEWADSQWLGSLRDRLAMLAQDRCRCFFDRVSPGPIDWYADPFEPRRSEPDRPWYEIPDRLAEQGDARVLWEASRAAWAFDLARASAYRLDSLGAGEMFWHWLDSWMTACPPFMGFQWKCGQESAIRLMALVTGFWAIADEPATTPQRWVQFAKLAWATGYRISRHIDYALSQKNNHAISEAVGLILIGQLFPEFREASKWRRTGRHILAAEIRRQCYDDGSYIQQSHNYHRLMLHAAALGLRLAELAGAPMDRDLYSHLDAGGQFLFEMMDTDTGHLPNTGNNDGALIWSTNECDFEDFRPVIQSVHYLVHREKLLPTGPWDEDLLWLFGRPALDGAPTAPQPRSSAFEAGGYYTLRRDESWAMIRCSDCGDRTAHYDQLHVDLWFKGHNILSDCGTYMYYVPGRPDVERHFKSISAHNTVQVDGAEPLELVTPFMYLPAMQAQAERFQTESAAPFIFEGVGYDYDRDPWRVRHRRVVASVDDRIWLVVDDMLGSGQHELVLRWHTIDTPFELDDGGDCVKLNTDPGVVTISVTGWPDRIDYLRIVRGRDDLDSVLGFASTHYGRREPIPVIEASVRSALPQRFVTLISLDVDPPPAQQVEEYIKQVAGPAPVRSDREAG